MFRLLFDRSADAMSLFDPQLGRFVDTNAASLRLAGAPSREALSRASAADISPERQPDGRLSTEKAAEMAQIALTRGSHRFEWLIRRFDGTEMPIDVVLTAISIGDRPLLLTVSRDISEQRRAQEALRDSQNLLASITANVCEGIYRAIPERGLVFVNEAYLRMFGYASIEELQQVGPETLFVNASDRIRLLGALETEGRFANAEVEFQRKDGTRFWGLASGVRVTEAGSGRTLCYDGMITDITARRRMEAELRATEQRWRMVFEQSPLSIQVFSSEGYTLQVNRAYERLFGMTLADVAGFNILADQQLAATGALKHIRRAFAGESVVVPPGPFELRLSPDAPSKGTRWIGALMFPLVDDGGKVREVVCIHEDLTERKRAEDEVLQLNATLERRIAERTAELAASEARARTLVEHAAEAIVVFDGPTGRFMVCNENAVHLYGLPREELLKRGPADVSPEFQPDGRPSTLAAREKIQQALDGKAPVFEWMHRHSSGRLIPCEVRLVRLPSEGQVLVRGSVFDNTERRRRERIQLATYQISEAVHTAQDLDNLYRQIHGIIQDLMPAVNFYIALFDPASGLISFPYYVDEHGGKPEPFRPSTGLTGYVLRTGRPLLVDRTMSERKQRQGDTVTFEDCPDISYRESGRPAAIWLGVPLSVQGRTLGVMALQDYHNDRAYGEDEKQILTFVAGQIALAIERKRAAQMVLRRAEQIRRHRNALLELALLDKSNYELALERICALTASVLNVARVGYWSLQQEHTLLVCETLYRLERGSIDASVKGTRVAAGSCPNYFRALATKEPIVANRVDTCPETHELMEGYLRPRGITSMLDVPVWLNGRLVGVLCEEHVGEPREWTPEEIDFAAAVANMVSLSLEAAQRTRSEQALRESEAKFRALFEASSQGVMLHDEHQFLEVNPAAVRIMGFDRPEDILGRHPVETSAPIQPGGESASVLARRHIQDCMTRGHTRFEWLSRTARGQDVPIEVILTRIPMSGRRIIQAVIHDISDRKKAEAELLKALAREKELGQLKSNFVSMVSHEFRTPLGIIMSSADILGDYFDRLDPEERRHHLQSIHKNTRRMADLMEEVLLIGRLDAGRMDFQPGPLDLKTFAQRILEEVVSVTEPRTAVQWEVEAIPDEAHADERLLRHIFSNLLTNAFKYSEPDAPVTLTIRREGADAVCIFKDRGIGIPEADLEWLFNAFHRARNVGHRPGTGLGLVIVKRCVELHGGRIRLDSKPGEGTTVTVRLPVFH